MIGAAIGSTVVFWLLRRYGRPHVEGVLAPEVLARFDGHRPARGWAELFFAFLVPGLPDDAIWFIGEMTEIPLGQPFALDGGWAPGLFPDTLIWPELAEKRYCSAVLLGARSLSGVQGTSTAARATYQST